MTLTHLPTRFSDFVNSPSGFISSAEGFVFVSALLVGRIYLRDLLYDAPGVRNRLWKRSLRIYGYHLVMLAFAFTVAAAFAMQHPQGRHQQSPRFLSRASVCRHRWIGPSSLLTAAARYSSHVRHVSLLHATAAFRGCALRLAEDPVRQRLHLGAGSIWPARSGSQLDRLVHASPNPAPGNRAFNLFAWQGCLDGRTLDRREIRNAP